MPDLSDYNNKINILLDQANTNLAKEYDISEIEAKKNVKEESDT